MSVEELAAAGERGKELIYKTDPEARVWYSSAPSLPYGHGLNGIEPAIASGAALSPDSPQDGLDQSLEKMELALTREPENSGRIAVGSVRAAVRYIRSERESEKGIPLQDRAVDPGDLDIEEAMAGFDWIRANVDSDFGKELRYAATEHRKQLNGNNKPRKPLSAAPDTGGRRPSLRQRRAARRQEQKQKQQLENEQRRERHEEDKRAELELLSEWQVENPINGTRHFLRALDLLDSYCSPSGEIVTRPKEGFDARTGSFVGYIARNPEVLEMEIEDSSSIASFLRQNDAPILGSMHRRIYDASDHAWENNLHIDNPDDFKEVFPKWLAILEGLSEDYRSSVEFLNPSGIRVHDANASEIRSTEASIHDRFNT